MAKSNEACRKDIQNLERFLQEKLSDEDFQ
jgi:hypothetical protein